MVLPLIALGIGILADYLFQAYFDAEEKKREEQYLAQGYSPRDVGEAVQYRNEEDYDYVDGEQDMDEGAAYLRGALFG